MSENFRLESGYLNASTKKRPKDIGIKYQGGHAATDHGHKPKHAEEVRRTSERIKKNNASKEHNDLLRNAEKKSYKAYKKPATSLIQCNRRTKTK